MRMEMMCDNEEQSCQLREQQVIYTLSNGVDQAD